MQNRVKYGLYKDRLTPNTVSLEHIVPHSQGGDTTISNLALASKNKNSLRGNKPIQKFLTLQMLIEYLEQYIGLKTPNFDGDKYIAKVSKTFKKLGYKYEL